MKTLTEKTAASCLFAKCGNWLKAAALFLAMLMVAPSVMAAAQADFASNRTDFRDESIYFVMTTRFYDGDSSNNVQCWDNQQANQNDPPWRGDFKGLIEKLDYIKALGFTAVWITPVVANGSGYDYHGYHAMDFSQVDHRYLSEDTGFQDLIDAAHAKGMKIVLDVVLQHTGNFGEENLCKLFNRDWDANQSAINECMIPYTQSEGGKMPDDYLSLPAGEQYAARLAQMKNTDGQNHDVHNYYHHYGHFNWDNETRWFGQIAGDCVDLNTENPAVYNYLIECYSKFIEMGVDAFRIDTSGHIPRLTFNKAFVPGFQKAGEQFASKRLNGMPFYMYGEVCARETNLLYRGQPNMSPFYYTWAEDKDYAWDDDPSSWDNIVAMEGDPCTAHTNWKSLWESDEADGNENYGMTGLPTSTNAFLEGNDYHTPDYSQSSGLNVIDFTVHWNFATIDRAWPVAQQGNDKYYNDATWNVVYVDSHDYAPDGASTVRFSGGTDTWASNLSLMFTHRGIPCVYYGSEIEFRKGKLIDNGPNGPLSDTGRGYFGGYIKGSANVTDFAEYSDATGNMAATLNAPLAKHIQQLNKIRQAVPALRKGQYSMEGCSGKFSFKRRYTDANTDSYALVTIQGNSTFTGVLNGTYTEVVTGETQNVTNGTLTADCPSNPGNLRVWVLNTDKTTAPGKVVEDGNFIYASSSANIPAPSWDGTEEEAGEGESSTGGGVIPGPDDPAEPYTPQYNQGEYAVFFEAPADGSFSTCSVWVWNDTPGTNFTGGTWPGQAATAMGVASNGNIIFKWVYQGDQITDSDQPAKIIFSNNAGKQTADLQYVNGGYYKFEGMDHNIAAAVEETSADRPVIYSAEGNIYVVNAEAVVNVYTIDAQLVYSGTDEIIPVDNAGVYIVTVGDYVQKIHVQ